MNRDTKSALLLCALLILVLGIIKHSAPYSWFIRDFGYVVAFLFQVFVPIWVIEKNKGSISDYGLGFIDFKTFDWPSFLSDLKRVFFLSCIIFIPYFALFYALISYYPMSTAADQNFSWTNFIIAQFLVVALSEEVFYRGFLQNRLLKQWPNKTTLLGLPMGLAIILTNIIFSLGHFVGEYNFFRLAPFFPGLLFSYLAFRSNSILGAIVFHAISNIFSQFLQVFFLWK